MRPTPTTGQKAGSMPQATSARLLIEQELADAAREGRQISHNIARMIAAQWQAWEPAMTMFQATGAIDLEPFRQVLTVELITFTEGGLPHRALLALDAYVEAEGERGPVPGWSDL